MKDAIAILSELLLAGIFYKLMYIFTYIDFKSLIQPIPYLRTKTLSKCMPPVITT